MFSKFNYFHFFILTENISINLLRILTKFRIFLISEFRSSSFICSQNLITLTFLILTDNISNNSLPTLTKFSNISIKFLISQSVSTCSCSPIYNSHWEHNLHRFLPPITPNSQDHLQNSSMKYIQFRIYKNHTKVNLIGRH